MAIIWLLLLNSRTQSRMDADRWVAIDNPTETGKSLGEQGLIRRFTHYGGRKPVGNPSYADC